MALQIIRQVGSIPMILPLVLDCTLLMFSAMRFLFAFLFATLMMVNAIQAKHFLVQTQDASQVQIIFQYILII